MRRMLPNAASLSEFGGLTGDCGPDATLMLLHCVNPARFPLTFAELAAINADEAARHLEAANGAQNIPSMDAYLTAIGVQHRTVGYAQFSFPQFHADLQAEAGVHGVLWETSTAGAGLPEDERGVQYHFAGIVGIDDTAAMPDGHTGGYYRVDGDSNTDNASGLPTAPIPTSWQEIQASGPIAYIIIQAVPAAPTPSAGHIPAGWHDDGVTLTAPNGQAVVLGFRDHILSDPTWPAGDVPLEAERHLSAVSWANRLLGGGQRQVFAWTILVYVGPSSGVQRIAPGAELLALETIEVATVQADQAAKAKAALADAFVASYAKAG